MCLYTISRLRHRRGIIIWRYLSNPLQILNSEIPSGLIWRTYEVVVAYPGDAISSQWHVSLRLQQKYPLLFWQCTLKRGTSPNPSNVFSFQASLHHRGPQMSFIISFENHEMFDSKSQSNPDRRSWQRTWQSSGLWISILFSGLSAMVYSSGQSPRKPRKNCLILPLRSRWHAATKGHKIPKSPALSVSYRPSFLKHNMPDKCPGFWYLHPPGIVARDICTMGITKRTDFHG